MIKLSVKFVRSRERTPLVEFAEGIGFGAVMTPAQIRKLAVRLMQAAAEAEARPLDDKSYRASQVDYDLTTASDEDMTTLAAHWAAVESAIANTKPGVALHPDHLAI